MKGLTEYITEWVSSGKNSKYHKLRFPLGEPTVEKTIEWLDKLGIEGKSVDDNPDYPPVGPGKLTYLYGHCGRLSSTHWIAVYNNLSGSGTEWTQELCIWMKDLYGNLTTNSKDTINDIDINTCIKLLEKMVIDPEKRIEL